MKFKTVIVVAGVLALAGCATMHDEQSGAAPLEEQALATRAADVLQTAMNEPQAKRIPKAMLNTARCIGVFPSFKEAAFIVGGARGHGIIACHDASGAGWSTASPAFFTMTSGSIGFQAGVQSSGVILLFLTQKGVNALSSKGIRLGADIAAVAGPVGWNANIESAPAPIVSYQVSTAGLFAGINLNGTTLKFDRTSTRDAYGDQSITDPRSVLFRMHTVPSSVAVYNRTLTQMTAGRDGS